MSLLPVVQHWARSWIESAQAHHWDPCSLAGLLHFCAAACGAVPALCILYDLRFPLLIEAEPRWLLALTTS